LCCSVVPCHQKGQWREEIRVPPRESRLEPKGVWRTATGSGGLLAGCPLAGA
jgi:hypothetical protein